MAKVIEISTDGTTWHRFPGSEGSFTETAEELDDTIYGQTFNSREIGLLEWQIETNGIVKGFAGYHSKILKSGTSTPVTGGALTLVSGKTFAISTASQQVIDRTVTPVVYDGVTNVTSDVLSIDYLFGRITFKPTYTVVGAITMDYSYLPMTTLAAGNAYTLTMSADIVDTSNYPVVQANGGFKTNEPGLRTVSLQMQGVFSSSENAKADLAQRTELICEIDIMGDGSTIARGFFKYINTAQSGNVGALEDETLNFALSVPEDALLEHVFNFRYTNSNLSTSIRTAITSWLNELNTYQIRYLPSGTTGQSPLDGVRGAVSLSDISLNGSLSGMNIFSITAMGTGAYTEV